MQRKINDYRDALCVMRYVKEKNSAFLFLITHNGALKVRSRITIFVWVIGAWNLIGVGCVGFGFQN
jgi:hypothetical protein